MDLASSCAFRKVHALGAVCMMWFFGACMSCCCWKFCKRAGGTEAGQGNVLVRYCWRRQFVVTWIVHYRMKIFQWSKGRSVGSHGSHEQVVEYSSAAAFIVCLLLHRCFQLAMCFCCPLHDDCLWPWSLVGLWTSTFWLIFIHKSFTHFTGEVTCTTQQLRLQTITRPPSK